jgi:hypothetical protein
MSRMFILLRDYYHMSIAQIRPVRPNLSHSATDSQSFRFSDLVRRLLTSPPLIGGSKNFFHRDPNSLGGCDDLTDETEYKTTLRSFSM